MKNKNNKKESFLVSVLILIISQVFIKILGLVYRLYLTNREGFGDTGNAIYSSGYQIYALLLTLSSVGVPNAISKLISERVAVGNYRGANRVFKVSLLVFALMGLLGTFILFYSANFVANVVLQIPEAELTLVALSPSLFFVSIISVIRGYFNGIEKISVTAKSQILEQVFKTLFTIIIVEVVVVIKGIDTTIMAAGANLATTFSIVLTFAYLGLYYKYNISNLIGNRLQVKYKKERIFVILKQILLVSVPIAFTAILTSLNKNIDSVTVIRALKNFLTEDEAIVQYGILSGKVDTIITLPMSFNVAFATALVPAISSAKAINDITTIKNKISYSLLITILIGLPCTTGLFIFSNEIISLLFPNAISGAELLAISSITIIFVVVTQTLNGALQGLGKVFVPVLATGIGLIVKLILNICLVRVKSIGVNGAAIASIVNNFIVCVIEFIFLNRFINLKLSFIKYLFKPLMITFIMGIASIKLYNFLLNYIFYKIAFVICLLFAIIIYIICVFFFKVFNDEEILSLPYGNYIYNILKTIGIYGKKQCIKTSLLRQKN